MTSFQQILAVVLATILIMTMLVALTGAQDLSEMQVVVMGMCLDEELRQELRCAVMKKASDPTGAYFVYLTNDGEVDKIVRKECVQSKADTLYRRHPPPPMAEKQYPKRP